MEILEIKRYIKDHVQEDLKDKMVFFSGPRQVGKTYLSRQIAKGRTPTFYLNWDDVSDKLLIKKRAWAPDLKLLILDEIHKMRGWKNFVKGTFDTRPNDLQILVTGSARLKVFQKGQDSLFGRYRNYRLHPFSLAEIHSLEAQEAKEKLEFLPQKMDLAPLMEFGGFPAPFLSSSKRNLRRWQNERFELVFREDIKDIEVIKNFSHLEILGAMLSKNASGIISIPNLSEDIGVNYKTIARWLLLLEHVYFIYQIPTYTGKISRALKKEKKVYLYDWSTIEDRGARFENLLASHLLKWCDYQKDVWGYDFALTYIRDREQREVDFCITLKNKPWALIECKLNETSISPALRYYKQALKVDQAFQVSLHSEKEYLDRDTGIWVLPASKFLTALC